MYVGRRVNKYRIDYFALSSVSFPSIEINKDLLINQYLMLSLWNFKRKKELSAMKKIIVKCPTANGDDLVKRAINSLSLSLSLSSCAYIKNTK